MSREDDLQAMLSGIHVTQTLLASDPDCNRRTVHRGPEVVRVFNADMQPWTSEMEQELTEFVAALKRGGTS